jgi:hypothetical protein
LFTPQDLQAIQQATDKTNEAIMVMKGNLDIMMHLKQFYEHLLRTKLFLDYACGTATVTSYDANKAMLDEHVRTFVMQLNGLESEIHMHVARAKLLVEIAGDRNRMVCDMRSFPRLNTNGSTDFTASPSPSHRQDADYDLVVHKRSHCHAGHNRGDIDLSTRDICFCKLQCNMQH